MLESVQLITGEIKQIKVIHFEEDQDKLSKQIEEAINEVNNGIVVICFTDLAGGIQFNVNSKLAAIRDDVRVIGGTNSQMLLSEIFQSELGLNSFVENILKEGKENIKEFK